MDSQLHQEYSHNLDLLTHEFFLHNLFLWFQLFDKYNFYGIPAEINTKPKDYGIYEFKRGFNGYVEQLIGEYTLPISMFYYIFKIISKIKR